jgi:methyl-accepting chemotaxis protein
VEPAVRLASFLADRPLVQKLLAPLALLTAACAGTAVLAAVSLATIQADQQALSETRRAATLVAEFRSTSRAVQRDAVNLVFEPDAEERVRIEATVRRRLDEMRGAIERVRGLGGPAAQALGDFVPLQGTVVGALEEVRRLAAEGRGEEAYTVFRGEVRAAERAASRITDAFIRGSQEAVDAATAHIEATVARTRLAMAAGPAAAVLGALGLALWIVLRGVAAPLRAATGALERVAAGDLGVSAAGSTRRDEVGALQRALGVFVENARRLHAAEAERTAAEARAAEERAAAMRELAARFEARVGGIVGAVSGAATELQATSQQMAAAVEETTRQTAAVSAASEQASGNVQTVAAAAEELSAAIAEVAHQVSGTAGRTREAAARSEDVRAQIAVLQEAVDRIGGISAEIASVASQTNLLALNATIEAARAGEAGKGFAVVAAEVKGLAKQTGTMTEGIAAQIQEIRAAAARTAEAVQAVLGRMGEISEASAGISASVEEQSAATSEISRNAQAAAVGTAEVSQNVEGVRMAADETGRATEAVRLASDDLARQAADLKGQVDAFLAELRAA